MKRAWLVVGPVSTGTRIITRLFVEAGCAGQFDHHQDFNTQALPNTAQIVWRGHSDGASFNLDFMLDKVISYGFEPYVVITQRDFMCMKHSAVGPHASNLPAGKFRTPEDCVLASYSSIWETVSRRNVQFTIASHDALAGWPVAYCKMLSKHLGLQFDPDVIVRNANAKYYSKALRLGGKR